MLVTLRARVEADDQSWKQFVYNYFDRPRKEIEGLVAHVAASKSVVAAFEPKPELMKQSDRAVGRELGSITKPLRQLTRQQLAKIRQLRSASARTARLANQLAKIRQLTNRAATPSSWTPWHLIEVRQVRPWRAGSAQVECFTFDPERTFGGE
ncbi:hypothetical protein IVB48_01585 [Bradyrhizobium sp. 76]|nr:hypothetical protein [Bradyrhizobium sp. 76]